LADEPQDAAAPANTSLKQAVETFERSLIRRALEAHAGDVAAACEELGLPRRTMNEKMTRYGLSSRDFR
jgi:two-component system C4-dicarboxylate transport response regulator DctD